MAQASPRSPRGKKKASYSFKSVITPVLKQVDSDRGITNKAKSELNSILNNMAQKLASVTRDLTQQIDAKTVTASRVENAVKVVLSGKLLNFAISEGKKATTSFQTSIRAGSPAARGQKQTKTGRAGLKLRPALAEKYLREFGASALKITQGAPVYLAAVLEYLMAEILELSANSAKENKRVRIKVRDLFLSIENDDELSKAIKTKVLGGGVIPYIDPRLTQKKAKKRPSKKKGEAGEKKAHKLRPGAKALKNIKNLQSGNKSTDTLIQHAVMDRLIRTTALQYKNDVRFASKITEMIQQYVEQETVRMLNSANQVALHADKDTLQGKDITLILNVTNQVPKGKSNEDEIAEIIARATKESGTLISQPALDRLCSRAGNKRRGESVYDVIRDYIYYLLNCLIKIMVTLLVNARGKTMTSDILAEASILNGKPVAVYRS